MFGEERITIKKQIIIDEKRRITIPTQTKVIAQENIGIMLSLNKDYLLLYNQTEYEEILKKAMTALEKMSQSKEYDAKFLRSLQRTFFAMHCYSLEKPNNKSRLSLPEQAVKTLEFKKSIYEVGESTHLELYKDEETYRMIKHSLKHL